MPDDRQAEHSDHEVDAVDALDARLLLLLTDEPRLGVLECSRRLGVARGTVQARLDRLVARAVLTGFPPALDLAAMGYGLTAFAVLEIAQGGRKEVVRGLSAIDEVCEVHATTGQGDLFARLVARSNDDLQRVIDEIVAVPGVRRMSTSIALSTPVPPRVRPLLERVRRGSPDR
ncbi:Lrp/AsnC family transcriptional regulator [Actinosynnema mirum]|uniref:Transcriptional regulator, AsnC family n=1 Tax=Actinosynnema mirum (strain ATCC 29888 / DSM 43827 / JCM 3225 / NBRC 14064 / NCIMB 13271 / NRRL B-12336 / IMRU 3971 / 101) TaxID=446462 RepID=C6WKR4_ACTMD|nr:Lrp/AsnC family transcriptional regulator [Actinosynnema mirum]ACU34669.1 transcriptional regulator, AsnC family [Actinosynnema mirum DSM 43827]